MFGEKERDLFKKLELNYPAVAVKFCRNRPLGYEQAEGEKPLCTYLIQAQKEEKAFYITVDNESCMGKVVLGMESLESPMGSVHLSGLVGKNFGAYRTPAANARLYYEAPMLKLGAVNFVLFCPVSLCEFNPDLIVCVADAEKTEILLRASSYISGDLWESKCSYVMSCAWTYIYPYLSGKVNHLFTGMHLGLRKFGDYPAGLHIITIPYQKLPEMTEALSEMEWELPLFRTGDGEEGAEKKMDEFVRNAGADINYPLEVD